MDIKKSISKRSLHTPLICQICGDIARGMNFDVITCMSCKAFFRRHALRSDKNFQCLMGSDCTINKQTRGSCGACRLKKCFLFGMNPSLIRSPYHQENKYEKPIYLCQPKPLSLLNNDRSLLTFNEWNLLSNVIHAYDEQDLINRTQCCFKEQLSLPPKIRSKQINTLEIIGSFYTAVQPFIERSPYFSSLSPDIRRIILQNNMKGLGSFNTMLAALEANVFDNENHFARCNEIYGVEYVKESYRLLLRFESNKTLIKIILMILAFSNNCSIVTYDYTMELIILPAVYSCELLCIQNIFVTMLWKYLIYQYGYIDAIRYFIRLVKNYLDVLRRTDENVSKQHAQMVDTIIEKTTCSLGLNT